MGKIDFNRADYTFTTSHYPSHELRVLEFTGKEAISQLFDFEVQLISEHFAIDLMSMLGQPALFTLRGPSGERYVHGIIEEFEQLNIGRRWTQYRVRLVPTLKPLFYNKNSRIFQGLTVPDITSQVFRDAGLPADALIQMLHGPFGKRDYCVQYQESDFNFISRLLEEEGIFFYFKHMPTQDIFVMGDGEHAIELLEGIPVIPYRDQSKAVVLREECIYHLQCASTLRPGKVTLKDYRFKQPQVDLKTSNAEGPFDRLEVFEYPGEYVEPEIGQRLVKVRLEEQQATRTVFSGTASARGFIPGHQFMLRAHPRPDFEQGYLVLSVDHKGSQPQMVEEGTSEHYEGETYTARFTLMPSATPYRPPRVTHRPSITGIQSAKVVGPEGEEICCDAFGRIRVHFYWDRDGKEDDGSSCWVRVAHPWAGRNFGVFFLPRVGQEVLVQFIEGDPDRPIVIGQSYNGDQPPPYPLPANKTRSTIKSESSPGGQGFNELRFEDHSGQEEVFLHAQKDLNAHVNHCESHSVGSAQTLTVGGSRSKTIGQNQNESIGGNKSIHVTGHHNEVIDGGKTLRIHGGHDESIQGAMHLRVTQLLETNAHQVSHAAKERYKVHAKMLETNSDETATMHSKTFHISASESFSITCGQSKITMEQNGEIKITGVKLVVNGDESVKIHAQNEAHLGATKIGLDASNAVKIAATQAVDVRANAMISVKAQFVNLNS